MSYGLENHRIKPAVVCKHLKESKGLSNFVFCDLMPGSWETPMKSVDWDKENDILSI